jgi:hypothetical protein
LTGRVVRRRVIAAAIALVALYAGYMLWFRNLPLFAVDEVTITGATTNESEIRAAVEQAAQGMTTSTSRTASCAMRSLSSPPSPPWAPAQAFRTRCT